MPLDKWGDGDLCISNGWESRQSLNSEHTDSLLAAKRQAEKQKPAKSPLSTSLNGQSQSQQQLQLTSVATTNAQLLNSQAAIGGEVRVTQAHRKHRYSTSTDGAASAAATTTTHQSAADGSILQTTSVVWTTLTHNHATTPFTPAQTLKQQQQQTADVLSQQQTRMLTGTTAGGAAAIQVTASHQNHASASPLRDASSAGAATTAQRNSGHTVVQPQPTMQRSGRPDTQDRVQLSPGGTIVLPFGTPVVRPKVPANKSASASASARDTPPWYVDSKLQWHSGANVHLYGGRETTTAAQVEPLLLRRGYSERRPKMGFADLSSFHDLYRTTSGRRPRSSSDSMALRDAILQIDTSTRPSLTDYLQDCDMTTSLHRMQSQPSGPPLPLQQHSLPHAANLRSYGDDSSSLDAIMYDPLVHRHYGSASYLPHSGVSQRQRYVHRTSSLGRNQSRPDPAVLHYEQGALHPTILLPTSPAIYKHSLSNGSLRKEPINVDSYRRPSRRTDRAVPRPSSVPVPERGFDYMAVGHTQSLPRKRHSSSGATSTRRKPTNIPGLDANLKFECIVVPKVRPTLGIAIEGGANTRQTLPRIINIQKDGSAYESGRLKVGHVILAVDGRPLEGLPHIEAAQTIADSFHRIEQDYLELFVTDTPPKKTY
ncbi:PREDICTED: uncharacterized protein LOC106806827 [Priapulus caudatus]|uniref:Uncharacterized protein LOC106806827 n=1 Tax=Priapulus caudatus TaxID=37621 RepID=A0ABM1DWW3_PRICU|nr:PREDICTED: uncharacterized protein LOC106806827 [Priapulus caudatus]